MVGAAALVAVFFWNTATVLETPPHGRADVYVAPTPARMAAAERHSVIATAARFVDTAVRREHAERAYYLVAASLRAGTTRANWRAGDIPVVPYPVADARWKFDYSYADEIGLQVAVFPERSAGLRPAVFDMSLRAVGTGTARRWLVASWSPHGGGGGGRPSEEDGSPFRVGEGVPERASTRLGAGWLLVPVGLFALALLLPGALLAADRVRARRARRAHETSLRS